MNRRRVKILRYIIIHILASSRLYGAENANHRELGAIGGIVDYLSDNGEEEKIAMEMAMEDCCANVPLQCGVTLHIMDSGKDPLKAASSGLISTSFEF